MPFNRVIILIIDACGVGAMPDAADYLDSGASTLPHCADAVGGLLMPTCQKLGLGNIVPIRGIPTKTDPDGSFGKMAEQSAGKDSTTGHWEIGGVLTPTPFPTYPDGFPPSLVAEFEKRSGIKTIGNVPASGTEIIKQLGEEHLKTRKVILYTSADSVWQMAAHEEVYPIEQQYEYCQIARDLLQGEHAVARVIARPFIGKPGSFTRTPRRRDFSQPPWSDTILDLMLKAGRKTYAVGKIWDLFAERGLSSHVKTNDNDDGMEKLIDLIHHDTDHSLLFANLVDFDQAWGHRRDPLNFARALERFDSQLAEMLPLLRENDLLIITADHGCDPTFAAHTDHTREYVPLLVYGLGAKPGVDLGTRTTFADVACTVAEIFDLENEFPGMSFLPKISD